MLFSQSREIHRQLRQTYRDELFGSAGRNGPADPDDKRVAMMFVMDLFHRQVFTALQNNPLSALLSLGWTLSTTSRSIVPQMSTKQYLRIWSPFVCLVNTVTTATATASDRDDDAIEELFDLDDLRSIDRAFFAELTVQAGLSTDERRQRNLLRTNGELFDEMLTSTPFGTYQITATDASGNEVDELTADDRWLVSRKVYTYVSLPLNVRDRQRYGIMFERHETAERLRRHVEQRLRERFAVYHRMYGLDVRPWMLAAHERDPINGFYPFVWQIQKSALVWMFFHSMAALVTVLQRPRLIEDFVATVCSLDNFIECGLCHEHWVNVYLPRWKAIQQQSSPPRDIDLMLLETHNEIQTSTDSSVRLTTAAVQALREDYLQFARCVLTAITIRSVPRSMLPPTTVVAAEQQQSPLRRNAFWCTAIDRETARKDVCREQWELWANKLRVVRSLFDCDPTNRSFVKRSLLQLEWDRGLNGT